MDPGHSDDVRELGEVFTRDWVVDLILDAVGYESELDLSSRLAVEPACGSGAFLVPMVRRLVTSLERHRKGLGDAIDALRAVDVNPRSVALAREAVVGELVAAGFEPGLSRSVAATWVTRGDYLLDATGAEEANFVVGNPPYIRLENVPHELQATYRAACPTMRGRSDVYVGFFDVGLRSLAPGGVLGFICADRWMRNAYGSGLRNLVTSQFSVELVLQLHGVDVFEEEVSAYPAVVVIRRSEQGSATVVRADQRFDADAASELRSVISGCRDSTQGHGYVATTTDGWFGGDEPWPDTEPEMIEMIRSLERTFPGLEDPSTGTRIGIGVATGADSVFITRDSEVVEASRLLPLVMADDLAGPVAEWGGSYLINPWNGLGLVDLEDYPALGRYFEQHAERLKKRYVARKRPNHWYKTIDRVAPDLKDRPKLLIPDIKASASPVLDEGGLYPHHNLYVITSELWDLRVLGGLLMSGIAQEFIRAYSVRMRGGYFRNQAQNLRRIRMPQPNQITDDVADALRAAFNDGDRALATEAAIVAYRLDKFPSVLSVP